MDLTCKLDSELFSDGAGGSVGGVDVYRQVVLVWGNRSI